MKSPGSANHNHKPHPTHDTKSKKEKKTKRATSREKPVFGVCDQVRLKLSCSATENSYRVSKFQL